MPVQDPDDYKLLHPEPNGATSRRREVSAWREIMLGCISTTIFSIVHTCRKSVITEQALLVVPAILGT
jgi:hypothetical protein